MPLALCCVSHSPLLDLPGPDRELLDDIGAALDRAAEFVREFDPDLVVTFSPDHYNGFFYKLMPPFCIGAAASGVGDYGTHSGPLDVPADLARDLAESVLDAGVDVAMSMTMEVDHGTVQPLQRLLGAATARPVIPIFVNSVAVPLGPLRRAAALGAAVGDYLAGLGKRVLVVGSGGLSHDPPVPALATATGPARERILHGGTMSAQQRAARQEQVIAAAREFASGSGQLRSLNPDWDRRVLAALDDGRLDEFEDWSNPWITEVAGNSAHEVRTWVAAFSALASQGRYRTTVRYYRPAPALIAGFAVRTALPQRDLDSTSRRQP
ncbi:3-carboxyethylcatechol 2,3-dioxygenase [Nocardia jiangxiensis]|uniref:3-carboxyethylcatechol 2,3-dioxygenase n=1 Tax=Nocardia jiangxiensis TaxID=282685 RepID=UPI0002E66550|nr:3-carboxyethylcatechol 2,3-dioxygenase [Nocardia jiangxiensis]